MTNELYPKTKNGHRQLCPPITEEPKEEDVQKIRRKNAHAYYLIYARSIINNRLSWNQKIQVNHLNYTGRRWSYIFTKILKFIATDYFKKEKKNPT